MSIDLYLWSISNDEQLSLEAYQLKHNQSANTIYYNINFHDNIKHNNVNVSNSNRVRPRSDINLSSLRQYMTTCTTINLIKNYISNTPKNSKILISKFGCLYPLSDEDKYQFAVKTWGQLFTYYPIVSNYLDVVFTQSGGGELLPKNMMETTIDNELKLAFQKYWHSTAREFCNLFNVNLGDFTSWMCNHRPTDSIAFIVQQWLINEK